MLLECAQELPQLVRLGLAAERLHTEPDRGSFVSEDVMATGNPLQYEPERSEQRNKVAEWHVCKLTPAKALEQFPFIHESWPFYGAGQRSAQLRDLPGWIRATSANNNGASSNKSRYGPPDTETIQAFQRAGYREVVLTALARP